MIWARKTILATGGAGQIFRESTPAGTGDGIAPRGGWVQLFVTWSSCSSTQRC